MLGLSYKPASAAIFNKSTKTLKKLLPFKTSFALDAPPGTVVWTPANKELGSTLSISPSDPRLAFDSSNRLIVGLTASTKGTFYVNILQTFVTSTGTTITDTSTIAVVVTDAAPSSFLTRPLVIGTPLVSETLTVYLGNLGAGSGKWYKNGTATSITTNTYTLVDADLGATFTFRYTPSGGSVIESAPTPIIGQALTLVDENGSNLTDENGAFLTLGYNFGFTPFLNENGDTLVDENGNILSDFDNTVTVPKQLGLVAPYSPSTSQFNQLTSNIQPFTFDISDSDRYILAAPNQPIQVYAPNMSVVQVLTGGAVVATLSSPDALGYFSGKLDLTNYENGPRYFEIQAWDKPNLASSTVVIYAGYHMFVTGGKNTNTSALPAAASAAGMALQYNNDFTTLSVSRSDVNDGSDWYDQMPTKNNFGDQIFTAASSPQNPFKILGSFLRIRLKYDANYAGGSSGLKHWYGGILSSVFPDGTTNFPTRKGYYESRALLPHGSGTWPAPIWLLDQDRVKDPTSSRAHREIDVEQYNILLQQYTATTHRRAAGTAADTSTFKRVVTPDQRWDFHKYGLLVTDTQIIYYFDDQPVFVDTYFNTGSPNDDQNILLLDLALTPGPNNSPGIVPPSSYYDMYVDYVRYYATLPAAA